MPKPSLFDLCGNHWQLHGSTVHHHARGDAARPAGAGLDVSSYYCAKGAAKSAAPHVVLEANDGGPFAYRLALLPQDARSLAASLLAAADLAEQAEKALVRNALTEI